MKKTEFKRFIRNAIKERLVVQVKGEKIYFATGFIMLEFNKNHEFIEIASEMLLNDFKKSFTIRNNRIINESVLISSIKKHYKPKEIEVLPFIYKDGVEMQMFRNKNKNIFVNVKFLNMFDINNFTWYCDKEDEKMGLVKGKSEKITCYICPVRISNFEYKILK